MISHSYHFTLKDLDGLDTICAITYIFSRFLLSIQSMSYTSKLFVEGRTGVVLLTRPGPRLSSHSSNMVHETVRELPARFPTLVSLRAGV